MTQAENLIADFAAEVANTRKLLEALPEDKFDWKPHEKSMTLGALAGHVAEMPDWLPAMMEAGMDFAKLEGYQPFVPATRAELLEKFEAGVAAFAAPLGGRDDEFMGSEWTMSMGDKVLMQGPRGKIAREILIHHLVHHRGQLTVYLRLLDIPVPATYGGSADEPTF